MNEWISAQDRLPEYMAAVLVCWKDSAGERRVEPGRRDIGGWWRVLGTRTKHVTHWMPLPAPPEEEGPHGAL